MTSPGGWTIDDKRATKKVASLGLNLIILATESLMVLLIQHGALSVDEADALNSRSVECRWRCNDVCKHETDEQGNFIPFAQWTPDLNTTHIHPPRNAEKKS